MSFRGIIVIQFETLSLMAYLHFMSLRKIAEISETSEGRCLRATFNLYLYCPSACTYQNMCAGKGTYYAIIPSVTRTTAG